MIQKLLSIQKYEYAQTGDENVRNHTKILENKKGRDSERNDLE